MTFASPARSGARAADAGSSAGRPAPVLPGPRRPAAAGPVPTQRTKGADPWSSDADTAVVRSRALRCASGVLRAVGLILDREPAHTAALVQVVETDPVLTLRVLHLANRTTGFREWVDTVPQALHVLGTAAMRTLVAELLPSATAGTLPGLERVLTRALACGELSGDRACFTAGLLSGLAEAIDVPVSSLLDASGVSREVSDAVRQGTGPWGPVHAAVVAYERHDSLGVSRSGIAAVDVYDAHQRGAADAKAIAHTIGSS